MSNAVIMTEVTGGIGTVTLNKPWKLNAWDTPMRAEITAMLNDWNSDPAVKAGARAPIDLTARLASLVDHRYANIMRREHGGCRNAGWPSADDCDSNHERIPAANLSIYSCRPQRPSCRRAHARSRRAIPSNPGRLPSGKSQRAPQR